MSATSAKPIRSPSYPSMSLRDAVTAVGKIEARYRSSPVDRADGAKLIGYNALSGPANMALAALAAFGLVERAGKGEMRVSDRARAILHADSKEERNLHLRTAAVEPQLFRELCERFGGIAVPPEEGVITYLNRQEFNPTAVRPAARAFLQTMAYLEELNVSESHRHEPDQQADSGPLGAGQPAKFGGARVGDLVQWESGGVLMMEKPSRVRLVTDDGNWIAVEGSETGIPMDQVIVEERARPNQQADAPTFSLAKRDDPAADIGTDLRFKLGKGIVVQVKSQTELGSEDLSKLLALLTAQRDALKD